MCIRDSLSGGEKRRLTIARSLVTSPKLLMLDEPFSGVDPIAVSEIQEIIRMLRAAGLAILITDHNVRETLNIVDRAYLIFEGRVRRHGSKDFLVNDDEARRLYPVSYTHLDVYKRQTTTTWPTCALSAGCANLATVS